ncbi:MAG: DUF393 domain-containing protein [Pseudomonadota bacterium]
MTAPTYVTLMIMNASPEPVLAGNDRIASKEAAPRLMIYYDGSCGLCSAEIRHYRGYAASQHFSFVDVSEPNAELGDDLTAVKAISRFHVRKADGQLVSGARAFTAIWQELPGWRLAARIATLPGLIHLMEIGYRAFLPVRPLLSRIAMWLGAQPDCDCRVSSVPDQNQSAPDAASRTIS